MARTIPPDRFQQLVDCATQVFIEQGYARTQMADVAEAMGIAKGTLYLYVESKEALFDLVLRSADAERPLETPAKLPLPTPKPAQRSSTCASACGSRRRCRAARGARPPASVRRASGAHRDRPRDLRHARAGIATPSSSWTGRRSSIRSLPPSGSTVAAAPSSRLSRDISRPAFRRKLFRAVPDVTVAARVILETIVTWAVHRHWDPSPQAIDDQVAEDTVVQFIVGGLMKEVRP